MVRIKVGTQVITASGHAQSGKKGEDLVCAAVSAVMGGFKLIPPLYREITEKDGYMRIDFHNPDDLVREYAKDFDKDMPEEQLRIFTQQANAQALIIEKQVELLVGTLKLIELDNPKHVEVTIDAVSSKPNK